jgi:hypothetical protein
VIRVPNVAASIGFAVLMSVVIPVPAHAQGTIRACANPAGQLRLIGATDSCKSQETLVTWSGGEAPGVTGGGDHSDPANGPAFLSATPTALTTGNIATGFSGYMVWANAGLEFNSGNPAMGTAPSPSGAGCSITYTVTGRVGTFFVDSRPVTFPVFAFGQNDRVVRIPVGLTGIVGQDLNPPLLPTETVDVTLSCNTPGFVPPPSGPQPVPVKVVNWSLTGIGLSKSFSQ